jgi:putative transposase
MPHSLASHCRSQDLVSAHMAEVYGADVSKDTISRITDKILAGMTAR